MNLSSKRSDGVIGHAKQKQYVAQWDLIYHEMMDVKNVHHEFTGVNESTSEAWHHHESSQSTTDRTERHIQQMMKYIEDRGSPVLHNFVTKEVMSEEIRNDVLNAHENGKKKCEAFHNERIVNKTLKLGETIHRTNLKRMISIRNKPQKTTKRVIREMNMTEKSVEIARNRGLGTDDLLKYDVVPSSMLFDGDMLMNKPEKSKLIRNLEDKLEPDEYSYHHQPESAFLVDVMAAVHRVPLSGLTHFSDLISKFASMTHVYHSYGRCDYIFDIYNDNPSVKDSERLRRCSASPVHMSTVAETTPLPLCSDLCTVLPALHSLTGCDITSKIGTKKAALKADPKIHLHGFGTTTPLTSATIQRAEQYLVNVVDVGSKCSNFQELREHQFHFSKSLSHQNLPPTSQGLEPHVYRAFYNAYTTIHVLDAQLHVETCHLDPVDYGFTLENGHLLPSTLWKTLDTRWSVVCHCGKCARVTCPCQTALVKCSRFCKCHKTESCKNHTD